MVTILSFTPRWAPSSATIFLTFLIAMTSALTLPTDDATAQVTGTQGCLLKVGQPGDVKDTCVGDTVGDTNSWTLANFVTADQLNPAIEQLQTQIDNLAGAPATVTTDGATIVGTGQPTNPIALADPWQNEISGALATANNAANVNTSQETHLSNLDAKETEQDSRLAADDTALTDDEKRIGQNANDIAGIKTTDAKQNTQLTTIDAKDSEQDGRLDADDATLAGHEQRISQDETDIAGIKTTDTQQNSRLTTIDAKDREQDSRLDGDDTALADHEKRIGQNETDIAAIQSHDATQDSRLGDIEATNTAQDGELANHEERLAANEGHIADLQMHDIVQDTQIADEKDDIHAIQSHDSVQDMALGNDGARISSNEDEIASIQSHDATQDNRLDGIDQTNTVQDARLDSIDRKNSAQDAELATDENRITTNEHDIGSIEDGAVFYNRDASGKKVGGLTLNDGTGNPVKLGNIEAGGRSSDAANIGQLTSVLNNLGGGATINPDGSVTDVRFDIGGASYHTVEDALGATNALSVQYLPDEMGKPTNVVTLLGDGTVKPVKLTNLADGTADGDAVNFGQVKNDVSYDLKPDGSRSNSLSLKGGTNGPVRLHNLARGLAPSDAATFGQVADAQATAMDYTDARVGELKDYTDARLSSLSGDISSVRREERGGVASVMAASALRFDDRPGKGSIATGIGGFKGSTSFAAGVGYTTESNGFRVNTTIAHSFDSGVTSWNAGASWTFN